jgi:hypothetical protein
MADAAPVMTNIQGKLKAKIVFDPLDKTVTFQSYQADMMEYFDEFCIGWVLTSG